MKSIRHCLTFAALCLALPASADDKPAPKPTPDKPADGVPLDKAANGVLIFTGSSDKPIAGTLNITKTGARTLTLSGTKPAGGTITIDTAGGGGSTLVFNAGNLASDGLSLPSAPATDAEGLLLMIDLRVTLQHYEKLTTEVNETQLQRQLALLGDSVGPQDSPLADAMKAERKLRAETAATKEDLQAADKRVRALLGAEADKWQRREDVLGKLQSEFRARVAGLADEISKRAKDSAANKLQAAPALPAKPTP